MMFKYKKFFNQRNCKAINEDCDVIDVIFANDDEEIYLVVMC